MKMLELTTDNINAVSLEMTRNKRLFNENINHVLAFMLKAFPDKKELLSKIKVLGIKSKAAAKIDTEADVMEQIAMNIFSIKCIDKGDFISNMLVLFQDLSSFSRAFLIYFYKNSDLDQMGTKKILDALVEMLLNKARLEKVFEDFMGRFHARNETECSSRGSFITESGEAESEEDKAGKVESIEMAQCDESDDSTGSVVSLVSLDDSDEIKRLDASLATLFDRNEKKLSDTDLMVCTKALDIMEVILENNYLGDVDIIPALLCISSKNQVIFRRALSVIRMVLKKVDYKDKKELFEMFCCCLEWHSDLAKATTFIVDICGESFDWPLFFETIDGNRDIDLGVVDRTCVPSFQFYNFLGEVEDLKRFSKMAKSIIRNETDTSVLMKLDEIMDNRPNDGSSVLGIKNAISSRINAVAKEDNDSENVKRTKHEDEGKSGASGRNQC